MATIADIAIGSEDHDILVAALQFIDAELDAGLVDTLSDPTQDLTVFAPTDAAFTNLALSLGYDGDTADEEAVTTFLATTVGAETLRDVVLYHVSGGSQDAAAIAAAGTVSTLNGGDITAELPRLRDLEPDLLDPSVTTADVAADNGIVHIVDQVLLPIDLPDNDAPTLTGIVAASGGEFDTDGTDFDLLLNAVLAADLAGALDDPAADLTVFAPNDDAFVATATALGYTGTDEEGAFGYIVDALTLLGAGDPIPLLSTILTYHVAAPSLQSSQVLALTDPVVTLQGGEITVNGTALVDLDPDLPDANLIATDVVASNGIAHVIDGVLLPADILASDGANDVDFLLLGDEADDVSTGADADYADGNGGADTLRMGEGDDVALGGSEDDRIVGGAGADTLRGEEQNDTIKGGQGGDDIVGGHGNDRLFGGKGGDLIDGSGGADRIFGDRGADTIDGGRKNDKLTGDGGADLFVFNPGGDRDTITDFKSGKDQVDLTAFDFADFDAVLDAAGEVNKGVRIDLGDGDAVVLAGLAEADLIAGDFLI